MIFTNYSDRLAYDSRNILATHKMFHFLDLGGNFEIIRFPDMIYVTKNDSKLLFLKITDKNLLSFSQESRKLHSAHITLS